MSDIDDEDEPTLAFGLGDFCDDRSSSSLFPCLFVGVLPYSLWFSSNRSWLALAVMMGGRRELCHLGLDLCQSTQIMVMMTNST